MKRHRATVLFFATFVGVLGFHFGGATDAANASISQQNGGRHTSRCSLQALKGNYAVSLFGWAGMGPDRVPYSEVGFVRLDGKGGLTAATTFSLDGVVDSHEVVGTYTVEPDMCTGEAVTNIGSFAFVVGDNVNQTRIIATTQGFTVNGEAIRQ